MEVVKQDTYWRHISVFINSIFRSLAQTVAEDAALHFPIDQYWALEALCCHCQFRLTCVHNAKGCLMWVMYSSCFRALVQLIGMWKLGLLLNKEELLWLAKNASLELSSSCIDLEHCVRQRVPTWWRLYIGHVNRPEWCLGSRRIHLPKRPPETYAEDRPQSCQGWKVPNLLCSCPAENRWLYAAQILDCEAGHQSEVYLYILSLSYWLTCQWVHSARLWQSIYLQISLRLRSSVVPGSKIAGTTVYQDFFSKILHVMARSSWI